MFEGYPVELWMERMILEGGEMDDVIHYCKVLQYNEDEERIELLLRGEDVSVISLDAVYECKIMDGEHYYKCNGRVEERFIDDRGCVIILEIKNGFYKNTVN